LIRIILKKNCLIKNEHFLSQMRSVSLNTLFTCGMIKTRSQWRDRLYEKS